MTCSAEPLRMSRSAALPIKGGADERELVRRVQARDQMAFRDLVERHQYKVCSIAWRILRNRQDVEDVAQQVFTKVYFAIKDFDGRSSLLTWIYRIAINECYTFVRRNRTKAAHETELSVHESSTTAIDTTIAQRDFLNKLLAHLSEEDRLLLILKEVEGYSISELVEMTGLNASAVKMKLLRARQRLLQSCECQPDVR